MTRAERKAGEFLKRLERKNGGDRKSDYHDDNLINAFAEVISENNIPIASAYRDRDEVKEIPMWKMF